MGHQAVTACIYGIEQWLQADPPNALFPFVMGSQGKQT